jgi:hypothetical protein
MKSPARWILIGLLIAGAGLAWGLIPRSEEYSDFGFGTEGLVDVQCGSAFSVDVDPQFRDYEEGQQYRFDLSSGYDPPIFAGQTATQVCEDLTNGPRTVAIAALAGGVLLALIGIVGAAGSRGTSQTAPALGTLQNDAPPPPPPPPSPTPTPAPSAGVESPLSSSPPPPEPSQGPSPSPQSSAIPTLVFSDGRQVELAGQIVIGRDPTPPADSPSATVFAVSDATVSKTHVRAGVTGADVWIEDLHSRNGVSIVAPTGETLAATPGQRMILDVGDRVIVGDSTAFAVDERPSGAPGRMG